MEILSDDGIQILKDRYRLKNKYGALIETPEQLFSRVAKHVSSCKKTVHYPKRNISNY